MRLRLLAIAFLSLALAVGAGCLACRTEAAPPSLGQAVRGDGGADATLPPPPRAPAPAFTNSGF